MFDIEKNVEIPKKAGAFGRPNKYPFGRMDVGDSFIVPFDDEDISRVRNRVSQAINKAQKKSPSMRFTLRKLPEGVRVWRVE